MWWIDFILDIAGVLLWFSWLSHRFDPVANATARTLVGTLRRANPVRSRRWLVPAGLALLLLSRAWIYYGIGGAVNWTPSLHVGVIALPFHGGSFGRMLAFSVLSFLMALATVYMWLLLLSVANAWEAEPDPLQRLVRAHLGWLERLPAVVKLMLPLTITTLCWLALRPLMIQIAIIPAKTTWLQSFQEGMVMGLGVCLGWKYLLAVVMLLYLLNSYVYLGRHFFWIFVQTTGRNLLAPIRWLPLRAGRVDIAPLVAVALVFLVAAVADPLLTRLYQRLST